MNDLAVLRGGESRMADLHYAVDGEPVAKVRCDGVIFSTPVGSTAYNLAAGGPSVSWRVRCFVLSFIAAHHLDTRPLVIGPEETLVVTNAAVAATATCSRTACGSAPSARAARSRSVSAATTCTWGSSRSAPSSAATARSSGQARAREQP